MSSSLLFHTQSLAVMAILLWGLFQRKKPQTHARLMSVAIAWDLLLVAQIEISREAIAQAIQGTPLVNIHVSVLVLTALLYRSLTGLNDTFRGKDKRPPFLVQMMGLAMIWNLLLVMQIELSRGVPQRILEKTPILVVHMSAAILSLALYFILIPQGQKLLAGAKEKRTRHMALGVCALIARGTTLATSFFIVP